MSSSLALLPVKAATPTITPASVHLVTGSVDLPEAMAFNSVGSMSQGRTGHTITALTDGTILSVGGSNPNPLPLWPSPELYDPIARSSVAVGNLHQGREDHTATLLNDGSVLIVGGNTHMITATNVVERYNPTTRTFDLTHPLSIGRQWHTATRLTDGRVLVAGGYPGGDAAYLASAELYDPGTGTWTPTGNMTTPRALHSATLLPNGKVLIAGGTGNSGSGSIYLTSAELYDPVTGTFTSTGSMQAPRSQTASILLSNGKVLFAGGYNEEHMFEYYLSSAELYDPMTGIFSATGSLLEGRAGGTAIPFSDGRVLIISDTLHSTTLSAELYNPTTQVFTSAGHIPYDSNVQFIGMPDNTVLAFGGLSNNQRVTTINRGTLIPPTTLSGQLYLPGPWSTTSDLEVGFSGNGTSAPIVAGVISVHSSIITPDQAFSMESNKVITTTLSTLPRPNISHTINLTLKDSAGRSAVVVTGTVNIDAMAPQSSMTALPLASSDHIPLSWSGQDISYLGGTILSSGIASYTVQVRTGMSEEWQTLLENTTLTNTVFLGTQGTTYAFRVRAVDVAGNVEPWPIQPDAITVVDTVPPTGSLTINKGALATSSRTVQLGLTLDGTGSSPNAYRVSEDGVTWTDWKPYISDPLYTISGNDGLRTITLQVKDQANNISSPFSDTIRLDTSVGTENLISINAGTRFVNTTNITLTVGIADAAEMQISNDGGFGNAVWMPFDTRPSWTIEGYGSYVIPRIVYVRVRDIHGTISSVLSDDIIYDPVPPSGSIRIGQRDGNTVHVELSASDPDNLSGVAGMRIGLANTFATSLWEPFVSTKTIAIGESSTQRLVAEFRDGAGNISLRQCVTIAGQTCPAYTVYLPTIGRSK